MRVLYVDLARGKTRMEADQGLMRGFLGGRGAGSWIFYRLGGHRADPLSPDNPLIVASGPLGGTRVPMATRAYAVFKSPLTGIFGGSGLGGTLGARMRYAGVDVLVVVGKADRPTTLIVRGDEVRFEDASDLWGRDAIESEVELKKVYGRNAAVLTIGPAGENMVRYASINHEYWRQFGRTGAGAVMGSKRLKAVVFIPVTNEVNVARADMLDAWIREFLPHFMEKTRPLRDGGTLRLIDMGNPMGFFPAYYWTRLSLDGWEAVSWSKKILPEHFLRPEACLYCPAACHRPVKGKKFDVVVDLEYETVFAVSGLCGVKDIEWTIKVNDLADRLGLDTITLGNVLAFAITVSKRGRLPLELDWGDGEALARLVEDIAHRRGIGDLLAEGVLRAARTLGMEDEAVHVKGLEPAGYDPRVLRGMALNYAIGYRGADHLATMAYAIDIPGKFGGAEYLGPEKVEAITYMEDMAAVLDSLVLCKFGRDAYDLYPGGSGYETFSKLLTWVTGVEWKPEDVRAVGERIVTLDRWLNVNMGVTRKDDRLPEPLLRPVEFEGKQKAVTREEVDAALTYYYQLRGWDENGIPRRETLKRLDLE